MQLIAEKRSRTDKLDTLRCVRTDGSSTSCPMPRQGILPHDLLHYVVESALPLRHGFLSLVARGAEAQFTMEALHNPMSTDIATEAVQVEAVVEGLQSQLWSGTFELAAFLDGVASACRARNQPMLDFSQLPAGLPLTLYTRALELNQQWSSIPWYGTLTLQFLPQTA